ncbi:MAG: glycosyltransferase family 39 protein [Actinomycetota bacterium]|nr:glycosyltransferase family 39 protein [Actinomycetota bacterium]
MTRRAVPWPWVVFGLASATGLAMALVVFRVQSLVDSNIDPYFFGEMGASIADGRGFEGFGSLITRRAPLYPLMIGGVYAIFGEHERLITVLQAFMFAGTCVLAYDLGRRLFNQRTGIIAGIACAFHPMLLRYIPSLHLETQLTLLMTLVVWLMVRFYERPSVRVGAFIGLAAGAAALTKAVVVVYPVLFAVGIILTAVAARKRGDDAPTPWRSLVAMFVLMGCVIAPWTIRNYGTTGHFVPISSGTSDAFLRGFIFSEWDYITLQRPPYTDAENASNEYFRALAEAEGTVWERDDYETDQILNDEALRRLRAEPGGVARKTVVGMFTFWYQLTSLTNSLLAGFLAVVAWIFAIIGWRQARREGRPVWLLLLPIFYLNILLALLLALGRYSVPVLPALMVLAAFGADTLLKRRAERT